MTRRRRGAAAVCAAWAVALAACAAPTLTLQPSARAFVPRDYDRVYDAWTRASEAYSVQRFTDVLRVTATFESWEFRWAYVVRYADDFGLDPGARDAMLRASLADARERHRFFVTASGSKRRETDFTAPESAWRVLLVAPDGRATEPVELRKVVRAGATERVYFPSVSPYRQTFRIAFPTRFDDGRPTIPADADRAVLRFTGPLGTVELEWRFEAPNAR